LTYAIETGRIADLLLLDADPLRDITNTRKIAAVILGGRLFAKAELQAMLDKAAADAAAAEDIRDACASSRLRR
jgi:hypothetical protein